jgi:hypothetical protein
MKTKFYKSFLTLFLLSGALVLSLTQCKKVGTSEWPEPNPETQTELKISVFDGDQGASMEDLTFSVIYPDGIMKQFESENGKLNLQSNQVGLYVVSASKQGYLTHSSKFTVEENPDGIVAVAKENIYLNKLGTTNTVLTSGTSISIASDFEQNPTLTFPEGAVASNKDVTVTFIPSPAKFGEFKVLGERAIQAGFNITPDLSFPADAKPILELPVTIPSVISGETPFLLGSFNEDSQEWEIIEGVLNEDRTMATFEMPHFSVWYTFTGYRLVIEETWSPYQMSGQSEACSEGACGTFVYAINLATLTGSMVDSNYPLDVKAVDTRCIGPRYLYAQQLFTRVLLYNYSVFDYTGEYIETLTSYPQQLFNWKVEEQYCHHQGWGN